MRSRDVEKIAASKEKWFEDREKKQAASFSLFMTHLALNAFRLDHKRYPHDIDELVPSYLDAVPPDPFTGGPVQYRLTGDRFVLYSVGEDRKDDGGEFGDEGNDSSLETLLRGYGEKIFFKESEARE